jgi:hypothetical protein
VEISVTREAGSDSGITVPAPILFLDGERPMSMIYALCQASDETIRFLSEDPQRILPFVGCGRMTPSRPSFWQRLFVARTVPEEFSLSRDNLPSCNDLEHVDLDKAWHGIHYLLTGSDWEGDPPAGFLLNWGENIGEIDVGYGPARAFTSDKVNQIAGYLNGIDERSLQVMFSPKQMMEMDIYPTIWDRDPSEDDTLGYLLEYFRVLKGFIERTTDRKCGMVVYLS